MNSEFDIWLAQNEFNSKILNTFSYLEKEDLDNIYHYLRLAFYAGMKFDKNKGSFDGFFK